ncbi:hypothetical protein L9F63_008504, partial [Diploptera punctata]
QIRKSSVTSARIQSFYSSAFRLFYSIQFQVTKRRPYTVLCYLNKLHLFLKPAAMSNRAVTNRSMTEMSNIIIFNCGKLYQARILQMPKERATVNIEELDRVFRLNLSNISHSNCEALLNHYWQNTTLALISSPASITR